MSDETRVEKSIPKAYIALIGFVMFFLPLTLFLVNHLLTVTLEKSPPEITLIDIPRGVGVIPVRLTGVIKDGGSGVKSTKISMNQGQVSVNLLQSDESGKEIPFEIKFDERLKAIEDGEAVLVIEAKDSAKNISKREFKVIVDRKRPTANLALPLLKRLDGTPELCFLVAQDSNLVGGSIKGREIFSATSLDSNLDGVYVAWVSNRLGEETKVFFEDAVGNTTTVDCTATVVPRKNVTRDLKTTFPLELILKLEEELKRESAVPSLPKRGWSDVFSPVSKGKIVSEFGDTLFDSYFSLGIFYAPNDSQKDILAPSSGIIRKIFDHSGYGKTLVIDFGMDLIGTISGFKTLEVKAGDSIKRGDFLGTSGKIPLTNSALVLFTMRVGDDFVDPALFLDSSKYVQGVPKRIGALKRLLGVPLSNPLER